MIYRILKFLVNIILKIFFARIFFTNKKAIAADRPVILALNHPTAFIDPIFICTHIRPITHFMLRGDLFTTPLYRWFLGQIKTIPIFRKRDGFSSLKQNEATFDYCAKLLHERAHIVILAEGETKHEKRLRPIQKGTARMAFGTYEKYGDEDIEIVPVGMNYTDSVRFRAELYAEVGTPIAIKDYLPTYKENPRRAILQVTREIQRQLDERVIHIQNPEDDEWIDRLLLLHRNDWLTDFWPQYSTDSSLLRSEVSLAKNASELEESQKLTLAKKVNGYFEELEREGITDRGLAQSHQSGLRNTLFLVLTFPIFLIGYMTNFLPFLVAKKVADQTVKRLEFHSSIRLGVCLAVYLIQFILLFAIVASVSVFMFGKGLWVLLLLLIPFLGYFAVFYQDVQQRWSEARKVGQMDQATREVLVKKREALENEEIKK